MKYMLRNVMRAMIPIAAASAFATSVGCESVGHNRYLIGPKSSTEWFDIYREPGEDIQRGLERLEELREDSYSR